MYAAATGVNGCGSDRNGTYRNVRSAIQFTRKCAGAHSASHARHGAASLLAYATRFERVLAATRLLRGILFRRAALGRSHRTLLPSLQRDPELRPPNAQGTLRFWRPRGSGVVSVAAASAAGNGQPRRAAASAGRVSFDALPAEPSAPDSPGDVRLLPPLRRLGLIRGRERAACFLPA